jgi:tetratricopeptide (TPR) repeat protein
VEQDRERYQPSDERYRRVLEKWRLGLQKQGPEREMAESYIEKCLEGLVYNARADNRPKEAEALLREGLELLPKAAGYYHFQLGVQMSGAGRPQAAIEHFDDAMRNGFSPRECKERIRALRTSTPGCLVGR